MQFSTSSFIQIMARKMIVIVCLLLAFSIEELMARNMFRDYSEMVSTANARMFLVTVSSLFRGSFSHKDLRKKRLISLLKIAVLSF